MLTFIFIVTNTKFMIVWGFWSLMKQNMELQDRTVCYTFDIIL